MNEDEARKCYELAQNAVKQSDFDKARRFLTKSIKLHSTPEA